MFSSLAVYITIIAKMVEWAFQHCVQISFRFIFVSVVDICQKNNHLDHKSTTSCIVYEQSPKNEIISEMLQISVQIYIFRRLVLP